MKLKLLTTMCVLVLALGSQTCLLEEPVTQECIKSISPDQLDQEASCLLCIIATNKNLFGKAEEFCKKGNANQECGFGYFQSLIANNKIKEAFTQEYFVFFGFPFAHNKMLNKSLTKMHEHLIQLERQIEQQTEKTEKTYELAIIKLYLDKSDEGMKLMEEYLKSGKSQGVEQHFLMLRLLHRQNQLYDALTYVQKIIKSLPTPHPYLHHLHGNFLMHIIQFRKAIAEFQKANEGFKQLYRVPNGFSFTNYNIGICYEKINEFKNAIKYYELAVIDSNSAESLNALAHSYEELFDKEEKKEYFNKIETYYKKSLKVDENYTIALYNYGVYKLKQLKLDEAIQLFKKCNLVDPQFKSCSYGLIKAYYLSKKVEKADEIMFGIEKSQQNLAELGALLNDVGDAKKALKLIKENTNLIKSALLMEIKGMCEFSLENFNEAEESFAQAIYLGAKSAYIYFNLGIALQEQSKYQESIQAYKTAYKIDKRTETLAKITNLQKKLKKSDQL